MPTVVIAFPPGGGGNHLKNIISIGYSISIDVDQAYKPVSVGAHTDSSYNIRSDQVINAIDNPAGINILHGHFGEIMSFQNELRIIDNKKFILISPETEEDRRLVDYRRSLLKFTTLDPYFDNEQVFLYECFMYHYYFNTSFDNIMNIAISELFSKDISQVIKRINQFLEIDIDSGYISQLHDKWIKKSNL